MERPHIPWPGSWLSIAEREISATLRTGIAPRVASTDQFRQQCRAIEERGTRECEKLAIHLRGFQTQTQVPKSPSPQGGSLPFSSSLTGYQPPPHPEGTRDLLGSPPARSFEHCVVPHHSAQRTDFGQPLPNDRKCKTRESPAIMDSESFEQAFAKLNAQVTGAFDLGKSFGMSRDFMERQVWISVERHLEQTKMQELYGGFVYIVTGRARSKPS